MNKSLFFEIKDYMRSVRFYTLFIAIIFFASAGAGYIYSSAEPELSTNIMEELIKGFGELLNMSSFYLMFAIYFRNSFACLLSIGLGFFFGIAPVGIIAFNGFIVGVVVFKAMEITSFQHIVLGIIPHGIIELPMVFLSAAIGLKIGHEVTRSLLTKEGGWVNIKNEFFDGLQAFVYVVLPLLFLAAMIEAYVTSQMI